MSTKIYDGYIINKELSSHEIELMIKKIKAKVDPVAIRLHTCIFASKVVTYYDSVATSYLTPKTKYSAMFVISEEEREARKNLLQLQREPDWDYDVDIRFYPVKGCIPLIIQTEHNELRKAVCEAYHHIKYYGYWDNTDPDENCSVQEWKERERMWNRIFKNDVISFRVHLEKYRYHRYSEKYFMEQIPSFEQRVLTQSKNHVIVNKIRNLQGNTKDDIETSLRIASNTIIWLAEGMRNEDPEVMQLVEAEKDRCKPLMKEFLTMKDLQEKINV
jgi:hypothetical protein